MEPLAKYRISGLFCILMTFCGIQLFKVKATGTNLDYVMMSIISIIVIFLYAYVLLRTGQSYKDTWSRSHLIHIGIIGAALVGWYYCVEDDMQFVLKAWPILLVVQTVIVYVNVTSPDLLKSRWNPDE